MLLRIHAKIIQIRYLKKKCFQSFQVTEPILKMVDGLAEFARVLMCYQRIEQIFIKKGQFLDFVRILSLV